jgi:hypothetical protein
MSRRAAVLLVLLGSCAQPMGRSKDLGSLFPHRVHAIEDFETDIEKRWWLAGKVETDNVPPGSRRACRGTNSKDFDDKMGDPKARYTAVVFNPVPGPPMGKETRLRFRYWLRGTDRMRVQIFSLTNNYHRRLELSGLPQGSWQWGSVDMTQLRRPDGSGGPLSRIRIGMHDYYTGLDPASFRVTADFAVDGAAAGENLASKFVPVETGVWEMKLSKPLDALPSGRLAVEVKDRQGNTSRIVRLFSVK